MKRFERKLWAVILLAAFMALSLGVCAQADADLTDFYDEKSPAVLAVHSMAETWSRAAGKAVEEVNYSTGLYVDVRGYVLCDWHSVSGCDYVEVETASGERIRAAEILKDNTLDVAVLRLETPVEDAAPFALGDSDALRPGMPVIAIGNLNSEFGQSRALMTTGIISGVNLDSSKAANFTRAVPLLRTNALIGYGSDGGALLNEQGELVGMMVLLVDSQNYLTEEALTAALPASVLRKVMSDLIEFGVVQRPRMGVMVYDTDGPEEALKTYPPCGVLISEVEKDSPAEQAGLLVYDIITAIDGERVHNYNEMSLILDRHQVGDTITLTVYRCADPETGYLIDKREYLDFEVTLGKLD